MEVRIYRKAKSAMQSGEGRGGPWRAEFASEARPQADPLTGWTTMPDTRPQVRLSFASEEEALAWARSRGLVCRVQRGGTRTLRPKAYDENFRAGRLLRWTH